MLNIAVALLPVLAFLAALLLMDSFKLVSWRAVLLALFGAPVGVPTEAAGLTAWVPWLCDPASRRVCPFWPVWLYDSEVFDSADAGLERSMGRVASAGDNTAMDSFWAAPPPTRPRQAHPGRVRASLRPEHHSSSSMISHNHRQPNLQQTRSSG